MLRTLLLVTAAIVISANFAVASVGTSDPPKFRQLSDNEKRLAVRPEELAATLCVVHAVVADSRLKASTSVPTNLGDIITDSIHGQCLTKVREMVSKFDDVYGLGEGEAFLMGEYLSAIPTIVKLAITKPPTASSTDK
jgi:hypothetical protein